MKIRITALLLLSVLLICSAAAIPAYADGPSVYYPNWSNWTADVSNEDYEFSVSNQRLTIKYDREVSFYGGGECPFEIVNHGTIHYGMFSGSVTNTGTIKGGIYSGYVQNFGSINNGAFTGRVVNNYWCNISGGTFNGEVVNLTGSGISGGVFYQNVLNNGTISGGSFFYTVQILTVNDDDNPGSITGGDFYYCIENWEDGYVDPYVAAMILRYDEYLGEEIMTVQGAPTVSLDNYNSPSKQPMVLGRLIVPADALLDLASGELVVDNLYCEGVVEVGSFAALVFTDDATIDGELRNYGTITVGDIATVTGNGLLSNYGTYNVFGESDIDMLGDLYGAIIGGENFNEIYVALYDPYPYNWDPVYEVDATGEDSYRFDMVVPGTYDLVVTTEFGEYRISDLQLNGDTEIDLDLTRTDFVDLDGDGRMSINDVTALLNRLSGIGSMSLSEADVNKDGSADISDVTVLLNALSSSSTLTVTNVERYTVTNDDEWYSEQLTINGRAFDGTIVWTYRSPKCLTSELTTLEVFAVTEDRVYVLERGVMDSEDVNGSIFVLDKQTGEEIWRNTECRGASITFSFDTDGTLYYAGYYGPDCTAIDYDGNLLWSIDKIDETVFWPFWIKIDGDLLFIWFDGNDDGEFVQSYRCLNKADGTPFIGGF